MIGTPPPNRDRFLCAIAERVPPDRVQAVFLFPPMRQGPVETAVAVIAVEPVAAVTAAEEEGGELLEMRDGEEREAEVRDVEVRDREERDAEVRDIEDAEARDGEEHDGDERNAEVRETRPVVLTARYRHTLKGADRGKWELEILEQADAPLITIETVVRGVQARLDDHAEPERLGPEHLRAALVEGVWTTPAR